MRYLCLHLPEKRHTDGKGRIDTEDSMKILNPPDHGDYHLHSATLSDGMNTLDEIVIQAGSLNYLEIAVTDHNQAYMDGHGFKIHTHYSIIHAGRWQNIHNPVRVIFGVEADLLNEDGDICRHIQGYEPEFVILSAHAKIYAGRLEAVKTAYLKAIQRYGPAIRMLGHLCSRQFADALSLDDITEIVEAANRAGIALELDCANLVNAKTSLPHLNSLLSCCRSLYVNSDAHTLHEFRTLRKEGFQYLKTRGFG